MKEAIKTGFNGELFPGLFPGLVFATPFFNPFQALYLLGSFTGPAHEKNIGLWLACITLTSATRVSTRCSTSMKPK